MKGPGRVDEQGEWGSVAPIPASSSRRLMAMEEVEDTKDKEELSRCGCEKSSYERNGNARQGDRV